MKKLVTLATIVLFSTMSLTSCNSDTPQSVQTEVNNNSSQNLTARDENHVIDPKDMTQEEKTKFEIEAIDAFKYLQQHPEETEVETPSGGRAQILCQRGDYYGGHACVWNSYGYLVDVTWGPTWVNGPGGNSGYYNTENIQYHGTAVNHCSC